MIMNKLSARDIQLFVAGALALIGFRALIWLPYSVVGSGPLMGLLVVRSLIMGLALPIGIVMLMGRAAATRVAQIYLWVTLTLGCVAVFVPDQAGRLSWGSAPEVLVALVLLGLILWSRSRRFDGAV